VQAIEVALHEGCGDGEEEFILNGGVRRGGAERGRGKGPKGGIRVSLAVRAGSSSLNIASLFLRGN
jgi:hypothetical protein